MQRGRETDTPYHSAVYVALGMVLPRFQVELGPVQSCIRIGLGIGYGTEDRLIHRTDLHQDLELIRLIVPYMV